MEDAESAAIIGTQVIGHLRPKARPASSSRSTGARSVLRPLDIKLVCDFDGECPALATDQASKQFATKLQPRADTVVFDLGYADDGGRTLECLCKNVMPECTDNWCIFWSVRTAWTQLAELDRWLTNWCAKGHLPPLFVRAHQDARVLGSSQWSSSKVAKKKSLPLQWLHSLLGDAPPPEAGLAGVSVDLTTTEFVTLTNEINSAYLDLGFRTNDDGEGNSASGFYTGSIHLLRGGAPIGRYFSLTKNVTQREANLRRWVEGFYASVVHLLEKTRVDEGRLVLIGFAATMREVLTLVTMRMKRSCRAYALLTFDVPTKEEIETKVERNDQVLLLTDVISSGTLVEAVFSLIRRIEASVVGIASLVDSRRATDQAESTIEIGRAHIPLVTCGQIRNPADRQAVLSDLEYWVDPVSLVPNRDKAWGWSHEVEAKVDRTLDLLAGNEIVACGHIVDGSRHTSVYVNLYNLMHKHDLAVAEQIAEVTHARLASRGWADFAPSVVLYPSGVARIEVIVQRAETEEGINPAYQTAIRAYVDQLVRIWPKMTTVEVPRAFDPGGVSRCARSVEMPKMIPVPIRDIVLADDGIWRGNTVNGLTQIALLLGAQRILVAPLLARVPPAESDSLERLHSLRTLDGSGFVEVCYAFPLLLPVPFYGAQECPYNITINRLEDRRSQLRAIAKGTDDVILDLKGHTPTHCPRRSQQYSDAWVRARAYVELASEHQGALDSLTRLVQTAKHPDALLAIFKLFSEEWRLLGRARLRQTVRVTLRERAREVALAPSEIIEVRSAAITVLRSLFREDFVDLLPEIAIHVVADATALRRVVMQVATLREEWRTRDECVHFLEDISDRGPSAIVESSQVVDPESVQGQFELFSAVKSLSLELKLGAVRNDRTQRTCANELLHFLSLSRAFLHNTRSFVDTLAMSADTIKELKLPTFDSWENEWLLEHEPRLASEVLPHLQMVGSLLLRVGTKGHRIVSPDLRFLEKGCEGVRNDLSAITTGLKWLKDGSRGRMMAESSVVTAASRLMKSVLAPHSTTLRLLTEMRQESVHAAIGSLGSEINDRFKAAGRDAEISQESISGVSEVAALFASPDVTSACFGNVLDNLLKYAFPTDQIDARIALRVEGRRNDRNEPMVSLSIMNNGERIKPEVAMGSGGQRAAADLKMFGGHYFLPQGIDELPWRVVQRVDFLLW